MFSRIIAYLLFLTLALAMLGQNATITATGVTAALLNNQPMGFYSPATIT